MLRFRNIVFKGELSIKKISWKLEPEPYQLPPCLEEKREEYWIEYAGDSEYIYDGDILYLSKFDINMGMKLRVQKMKYSQLVTYTDLNHLCSEIQFNGALGFKMLLHHDKKILLGERSKVVKYLSGYYTTPGGTFEVSDTKDTVFQACKREIFEEIGVTIPEDAVTVKLVGKQHMDNGYNLILSVKFEDSSILVANEEWNGSLEWFSYEQLQDLPENKLTEELSYLYIMSEQEFSDFLDK